MRKQPKFDMEKTIRQFHAIFFATIIKFRHLNTKITRNSWNLGITPVSPEKHEFSWKHIIFKGSPREVYFRKPDGSPSHARNRLVSFLGRPMLSSRASFIMPVSLSVRWMSRSLIGYDLPCFVRGGFAIFDLHRSIISYSRIIPCNYVRESLQVDGLIING